jgi:hypothetical protein
MTVEQIKQRMMDSLPSYYNESPEADAIMHGNAVELQKRRDEADDLLNQFFVLTATWGLSSWERVLALPLMPHATIEFRRQRILAKLNGAAPVTIRYLTDLVNTFLSNKSAKIVEFNSQYRFDVEMLMDQYVDVKQVENAVKEVKPAHLEMRIINKMKTAIYFPAATITGEEMTVYPYSPKKLETKGTAYFMSALRSLETMTIKPEGSA